MKLVIGRFLLNNLKSSIMSRYGLLYLIIILLTVCFEPNVAKTNLNSKNSKWYLQAESLNQKTDELENTHNSPNKNTNCTDRSQRSALQNERHMRFSRQLYNDEPDRFGSFSRRQVTREAPNDRHYGTLDHQYGSSHHEPNLHVSNHITSDQHSSDHHTQNYPTFGIQSGNHHGSDLHGSEHHELHGFNNHASEHQGSDHHTSSHLEDDDCALSLDRSQAKHHEHHIDSGDGEHENNEHHHESETKVCITYQDVNAAIEQAKQLCHFTSIPQEEIDSVEPSKPVIALLGELNQETTKILAKKFDLTNDEIQKGLPLIDMSKTSFWEICPLMVRPLQCDPTGRFRSFTGHCNNLKHPAWGAAQTPFVRFVPNVHPDGIQKERASVVDGSPLPSPRLVSSTVHRDHDQPSSELSLLIMVWGQFIDHDVALAAPPRDERGLDFDCCRRQHPNCKPIRISDYDPFYSRFGQKCMDFKRSLAGLRPYCALGPRVHINTITATMDANTVYGSTKARADSLRTFQGGLLKVQDVFRESNLKPLLPQQLDKPDLECMGRPDDLYCFLGGDDRVNEQPTLTVLHTLYMREHNRMAERLARINSHWDDDRIYHETRHIMAAVSQNILVSEYLPLLIGHEMMNVFNLTSAPEGAYWDYYDSTVSPSISHEFSTAAFRQGHTFIQGKVRLHDPRTHEYLGSELLRNLFKRPYHYYEPGRMDKVIAGIINTPAQTFDPFVTQEISGHLFQEPGLAYGMDLPAINLARAREQGVPGYNIFRQWCGLPRAQTFEELQPYLNNRTASFYAKLYKHVDDIDLWSGGIAERKMPGAQVGPTFACIIARQFNNIKRGDRFWFENSGLPSSFTLEQIREIKKTSQAKVMCQNSDRVETIQRNALKIPHPILNPRVPCADIYDLNLLYWTEDPSRLGTFYYPGEETSETT